MSLSCRERVREVGSCHATSLVRLAVHSDIDYRTLDERIIVEIILGIVFTVVEHTLHINVFGAVVRSLNHHLITVFEIDGSLLKERSAEHILVACRAHRIESESREHIPSRSLTIVLIAAITIGSSHIEFIHHLAHPVLSLPRLVGIAVEIYHVLNGLIAVSIVAHIHDLHLTNLVDGLSVVAVVEMRRLSKHVIEFG